MAVDPGILGDPLVISPDVQEALRHGDPVVALESAVITVGLPYPDNLTVALQMQSRITAAGAKPAMVAVISGELRVGLGEAELRGLAETATRLKIGTRDVASAALKGASGGTTVAATMFASKRAGIQVFATGGIGGVHRESAFDVSADLQALARTRMIVVCSGAKSILNLEATLEALESLSVPVLGFCTDEFPAFYSRDSGLQTSAHVDTPAEIASYWTRHCALGMESAVLVTNPVPEQDAIRRDELAHWIDLASTEAVSRSVRGQELTPFLLRRLAEISRGRTIQANTGLLINNARLAAEIAAEIAVPSHAKENRQR